MEADLTEPSISGFCGCRQLIFNIFWWVEFWEQARSPTKILTEKGVHSPWLICKIKIWSTHKHPSLNLIHNNQFDKGIKAYMQKCRLYR